MNNGSTVVIDAGAGGHGNVTVDGRRLRGVRSVTTHLAVNVPPVVTLELVFGHDVKFEGASIVVGDSAMPASVEQALWKHLLAKYGREIDVTTLDSTAREWASPDD